MARAEEKFADEEIEKPDECPNCGHHIGNGLECENCGAIVANDGEELGGLDGEDELSDDY